MGVVLTRAEVVKGLEPVSAFQVSQVRAIFDRFEDMCPTPALWERAFFELLDCFSGAETCSRAFAVLDTDGNGLIDARETIGAMAVLSKGHLTERMALLFDVYDLNKEKDLAFDECFLMLRRTMAGLRKMAGIQAPPEKVIHNMTKQVWKIAKKHRDTRIQLDDWLSWWSFDSSLRSALKMVTWRPEEQRGLPTPDQWVNIDYTKGISEGDERRDALSPRGLRQNRPSSSRQGVRRRSASNVEQILEAEDAFAAGKAGGGDGTGSRRMLKIPHA